MNEDLNEQTSTAVAGSQEPSSTVEDQNIQVSTATETSTTGTQNNTDTTANTQPVTPQTVAGAEQAKKDGPWNHTKEEQMAYSFHKQLSKRQAKWDKEKKELLDRLERLENPEKYRTKTRADFGLDKGGDDEYINYLVDQKVKTLFESQLNAWKQEQEDLEARNAADEEYRQRTEENIKKIYPTPEAEKNFRATVGEAMRWGLGKLLDQDESLSNYILRSPVGPSIMYKLASSKDAVEKLFEGASTGDITPMDLQFRIRDLEREVKDEIKAKATQTPPAAIEQPQQTAAPQKVVGRPGLNKDVKKSVWDDDKSLLDQMRSM